MFRVALLALSACTPGTLVIDSGGPVVDDTPVDTDTEVLDTDPDDTDVTEWIDDTGTTDTDTTTTEVETWPKGCPEIYDQDTLPELDLSFASADLEGLRADCTNGVQRYRPVTFTYAGESVAAMARLKGNWSWSCEKLQFVVSFNEEDPDARFHGLRKIMLDAPWYDHTLMHERLANPLFQSLGLPYSCVNNARVSIDGAYYGLYSNVERIDHEYLERHFEESDGNLYQGGSELKTNEDIGDTSRLQALQAATTVEELETLVDLDQAVAEWAAEAMIPAMDNYWAGVEINYYLYDHPSRGFVYLPYDLDISFGDSAYTDGSLIWPDTLTTDPITYEHYGWRKEALFQIVLADTYWCERFVEELVLARAAYDPTAMTAQLDTWDDQIADALAEDNNKTFTNTKHRQAVSALRAFLPARAAYVDAWLADGDHCPARW
jgi:hypothetical protein